MKNWIVLLFVLVVLFVPTVVLAQEPDVNVTVEPTEVPVIEAVPVEVVDSGGGVIPGEDQVEDSVREGAWYLFNAAILGVSGLLGTILTYGVMLVRQRLSAEQAQSLWNVVVTAGQSVLKEADLDTADKRRNFILTEIKSLATVRGLGKYVTQVGDENILKLIKAAESLVSEVEVKIS